MSDETTTPNRGAGRTAAAPMPQGPEDAPKEGEQPVNPRDAAIEDMAERRYAERAESADQDAETYGTLDSQGHRPGETPDPTPRQQMNEPAPEPGPNDHLPEHLRDDPLASYIQMGDDGKPYMRAKVDGEETLVDLEKARAIIQKNEAADRRFHEVAERRKELDSREEAIREAERRIQERTAADSRRPPQESAPLPSQGEDDQAALETAKSIISNLFDGNEDDAVAQLAKAIATNRASQGTSIDPKKLAEEAAEAAEQRLAQREQERALQTGFKIFQQENPDLIADKSLFAAVDAQTDVVEAEHPEWTPEQIMREAGRQIREKFNMPDPRAEATEIDDPGPEPTNDRLNQKRNLRPMPTPAQDTRKPPEPEKPETPAQALADIRAARGQPV